MRLEFDDFNSGQLYQNEWSFQPNVILPMTKTRLYGLIANVFPPDHPIHRRNDFILQVAPFYAEAEKREVNPRLPPETINYRLKTICRILTNLMERREENNLPMYTVDEAYRAYSVIACNWLSIHGCLGVDGHGRTLMQLLPITLWASGYLGEFRQSQFLDPKTGEFDPLRGKSAIFYLNGHIADGMRILAARFELGKYGVVSDVLLDPAIIGHRQTRRKANRHAIKVIADRTRTKYN